MMSRYIDADMLKDKMFNYYDCVNRNTGKDNYKGEMLMNYEVADMIEDCIENIPTADVEEVVRCKNCKYCEKFVDDFGVEKYFCVYFCGSQETIPDGYCHRGRKND